MGFVLKIYFIGLIAFVPDSGGNALTAVLLDAREGYAISNGDYLESHWPMLVARAARCEGPCDLQVPEVAKILRRGVEPSQQMAHLAAALGEGGALLLDRSDIRIELSDRSSSPLRVAEEGYENGMDFSWMASIAELDQDAAHVDPDVMAPNPVKGLVAGRMHLDRGSISSYRITAMGDRPIPLEFETLQGALPGRPRPYADWIQVEIPISGCDIVLVEESFATGARRILKLGPAQCDGKGEVEIALLNIPEIDGNDPAADPHASHGDRGSHFEMYYELSDRRPPNRLRPVPVINWELLQQDETRTAMPPASGLLDALGLRPDRGTQARPICIPAVFTEEVAR